MPNVKDIEAIDGCIVSLKKLQRETRKAIQSLRELQDIKKSEVESDGITRETCGGTDRRDSNVGN
jgi:hypothetical protein